MAVSWIHLIQMIQDNIDVVSAKDTNRPLGQLEQRTQYLFDALQEASLGQLLVARNVAVDESTIPGMPVWFDTDTNTWKPAVAVLETQDGNDYGFAAKESELKGLVLVKHTSNSADIALYGSIRNETWNIDWDQVIDQGSLAAGRYYLSTTEGVITQARNVLSAEVGVLDSAGNMVFTPDITGNLRNHLHLRFELEAVIGASLNDPGWVPVASFGGAGIPYPSGAVYGYNVSQNANLEAKFPPQPLQNYWLAYNGVGVHKDSVVIDNNGIWWMNSTESPDNMGAHLYQGSEPANYFDFWMTLLNFGSKLVNTLRTKDEADTIPVTILDLEDNPSDNGDLQIFLKQVLKIPDDTFSEGAMALKSVSGVTGLMGPVLGRVRPGVGMTMEGSHGNATEGYYGIVTFHNSEALAGIRNGRPTLVALDGAREDFYNQLPVINLPQNRQSAYKLQLEVPTILGGNYSATIELGIVSVTPYTDTIKLQYQIVRPGAPVPNSYTSHPPMTIDVPANTVTNFTSAPIPGLLPGDILLVNVLRDTPPAQDIMAATTHYHLISGGA